MEKIKELRMTLVILLVGVFFLSGCFFNDDKTVTFKTNGGSEIKNMVVKSGSKVKEAPIPVKEGYIFEGWYLDGEEYNFDDGVEEDITLVAKWIKGSFNEEKIENDNLETTTTTTTKEITSTSKATTKKVVKKKTTTTTKSTTTTTTTTTTTKAVTTAPVNPSIVPDIDVPEIKPNPEPVEVIDMKIEIIKETEEDNTLEDEDLENKEDKTDELKETEYIKITRTKKDVNVKSDIDSEDLAKLLKSDVEKWMIVSSNGYVYDFKLNGDAIALKGDKNVLSFTVINESESYIFDYNEDTLEWTIKYPTVSVGVGLNSICYKDLETAIKVMKSGDTVRLLKDQEIVDNLKITVPIKIEGDNYKITNKKGYLFDLEEIKFNKNDEFVVNNLVLDVDSFIYVGKSKFASIILNNLSGNIKGNKLDKLENGEFENTNLLQHF